MSGDFAQEYNLKRLKDSEDKLIDLEEYNLKRLKDSEDKLIDLDKEFALLKKDLEVIQKQLNATKTDLDKIKGYFIRMLIGGLAVVGTYFVQWVLKGGLSP